MDVLRLIPKSERFTELYFNNHLALPKHVSGSMPQPFSFVIHNREGQDMEYSYTVYGDVTYQTNLHAIEGYCANTTDNFDRQRFVIGRGVVNLNSGSSATIDELLTVPAKIERGTIYVNLEGLDQVIHFHLLAS